MAKAPKKSVEKSPADMKNDKMLAMKMAKKPAKKPAKKK